jgi:ribosomal protein L40E
MGRRFQARRGNGKFTRNTMENTFGLSVQVCPHCRAMNPRNAGTEPLTNCHRCGESLDPATGPLANPPAHLHQEGR